MVPSALRSPHWPTPSVRQCSCTRPLAASNSISGQLMFSPTCRNLLQHCLDGYYNSTILHRLIPMSIEHGDEAFYTGGLFHFPTGSTPG
ncbi:hypothetical protein BGX38DRAFT_1205959 [Terfezia claveryi]|nr:hypothetical protein BGX38DRAFT_1205959 [Terfezia claveryi]